MSTLKKGIFVQSPNGFISIDETDIGIVMEVRLVQPLNAFAPILMSPLVNIMEVRPVQFRNAFATILVTVHIIPLGSVIVLGIVIAPVALVFETTVASVTLVVYKRPPDKNEVLSANGVNVVKYVDNEVLITPDL